MGMAELELKKFQSRFTSEGVLAVRFTGKQDQIIDIINWVIDSGGRAQGNVRMDGGLDLMVYEGGVGLIKVKLGEFVIKTSTSFEIHPVLTFTQMYQKVDPVMKVIRKPEVLEAMQFTGDIENENEIEEWLKASNHIGSYRHSIPGTTIVYYRIELAYNAGSIDIRLGNWIVKIRDGIQSYNETEFEAVYQRVA